MKANLETLKLVVPISILRVYHDDGYVKSMQHHLQKLTERYLSTDMGAPSAETLPRNVSGVHKEFKTMFKTHHHIFYRDLGPEYNTGNKAHEETEFLIATHKQKHLICEIRKEFGITIDFWALKDKEARAYIGTVFALLREKRDLLKFQKGIVDEKYTRAFQIARKLFE